MIRPSLAALWVLRAAPLIACSGDNPGLNEEEEAPVDGKLDSFRRPTDNGNLLFAEPANAAIATDPKFHVWTFELSGPAITSIESSNFTPTSPAVETVHYPCRWHGAAGRGS